MSVQDAIELAYKPRLKVFLSADIVGSTALKQNFKADLTDVVWPEVIQGFYRNFIEQIEFRWNDGSARFTEKNGEDDTQKFFGSYPKFWKTVGDEVLFWKALDNENQLWATLAVWLSAVSSIRDFFSRFSEPEVRGLDIKSSVWIAGFPVRNRLFRSSALSIDEFEEFLGLLYLSDDVDTSQSYDFVGPSIDIGFRLASHSSQRKMYIDAATAYLLAKSASRVHDEHAEDLAELLDGRIGIDEGDIKKRLSIFYSGSEVLKGVGGEKKYPKFWINTCRHGTSESMREGLMFPNGRQPAEPKNIIAFCEKFYSERAQFLVRPFINNEDALSYSSKPEKYDGELSNMVHEIVEEVEGGSTLAF